MSETSEAVTGTSEGVPTTELPVGDPSARITRIEAPIASPGNCAICGKHEHPLGFAQAGLDFEFYGTFYLCADCVSEYARLFGFISSDDFVGLREHIAAQDLELNTLRQAVLGLESTVDGLVADAHRRSTDRADRISSVRESYRRDNDAKPPVVQPDARPTDASTTVPVKATGASEQRPTQQVNQQGRDDVLDTSSADELLGL